MRFARRTDGSAGLPGRAPARERLSVDPTLCEELQAMGLVVSGEARQLIHGNSARRGGAGPAQGITLVLGGRALSVPTIPRSEVPSTYVLSVGDRGLELRREGAYVCEVDLPETGGLYRRRTTDGTPFSQIALLHGDDCLASTVLQECDFWGTEAGCAFCGIGTSLARGATLARKKPEQLAEVAQAAAEVGVKHVILTTGSTRRRSREIDHLAECTRAVKAASRLPVQAQCLPPEERSHLRALKAAGVDTLGLHIESLDPEVLARVAPIKAHIGWHGYRAVWKDAVEIFGRWQVTTYVIMGLGEHEALTLDRLRTVVEMGVYPHIVPLRPVPGSEMAGASPPSAETMHRTYAAVARMLGEAGALADAVQAGCGRCRACSCLSDHEKGEVQPCAV